jgi:hypothetical protein
VAVAIGAEGGGGWLEEKMTGGWEGGGGWVKAMAGGGWEVVGVGRGRTAVDEVA